MRLEIDYTCVCIMLHCQKKRPKADSEVDKPLPEAESEVDKPRQLNNWNVFVSRKSGVILKAWARLCMSDRIEEQILLSPFDDCSNVDICYRR